MKLSPLFAALVITALAATAQAGQSASAPSTTQEDHASHHVSTTTDAAALADGEIKKVDKQTGKLTIKHGPLTNVGMPAMTMAFKVADSKMLDQVKPGDKVRFAVDKVDGQVVVTQLNVNN